jgi:adenylyl- and sulfurtransferase ThiI
MKKTGIKDNLEDKSLKRVEEEEDLDLFIEKRKIQNEALKKIAGITNSSKEQKVSKTNK